jgi:hypothetical protein
MHSNKNKKEYIMQKTQFSLLMLVLIVTSCSPKISADINEPMPSATPFFEVVDFGPGPIYRINSPISATGTEFRYIPARAYWQGFNLHFYYIPTSRLTEFLTAITPGYLVASQVMAAHEVVVSHAYRLDNDALDTREPTINTDMRYFREFTLDFSNPSFLRITYHPEEALTIGFLRSNFSRGSNSRDRTYHYDDGLGLASRASNYPIAVGEDFYLIAMIQMKNLLSHEMLYVPINHQNPARYTMLAGRG